MTMLALAGLVGVSRQAMSGYEHGQLSPQPDNVHRMAAILDVPVPFFSLPAREESATPTFFRSLVAATKTSRIAAERRLAWVGDIVAELEEFVAFPDVAVPELADGRVPLGMAEVEDAATELRRAWMLADGPIHDVVALAESNGAIVTRAEAESSAIDAFSARLMTGSRPCIFLGAEKGSAARSRFDASHEIGHMAIHRRVTRSQLNTPTELKRIESEANAFASAFLLPAAMFAEDLYVPTLDGMRAIKPKWRVSIAAMLHRASALDMVSESHARQMWISLSRRGWRRLEPGDETVPLEQPTAMAHAFELVVGSGLRTAGQFVDRLSLSQAEVQRLASLPETVFDHMPTPVRLREVTLRSATPARPGQVVPFPKPDPVGD